MSITFKPFKNWKEEVAWAIDDPYWQWYRVNILKGASTVLKLGLLELWITGPKEVDHPNSVRRRKVQAANYLGALARGGFILLYKSPLACVHQGVLPKYQNLEVLK